MGHIGNKNDGATITLSVLALLIAIVLSINTFTGQATETSFGNSTDPFDQAQSAAQAGVEIAQWHIECNGYVEHGSLPPHFWINGATYTVEWDDVNMADSTVNIRSRGDMPAPDDLKYGVVKKAKVKLSFLPAQKNAILSDYYSKDRPAVTEMQNH
jgi:hypothetical protein